MAASGRANAADRCAENSLYKGWVQAQPWAHATLAEATAQPDGKKHSLRSIQRSFTWTRNVMRYGLFPSSTTAVVCSASWAVLHYPALRRDRMAKPILCRDVLAVWVLDEQTQCMLQTWHTLATWSLLYSYTGRFLGGLEKALWSSAWMWQDREDGAWGRGQARRSTRDPSSSQPRASLNHVCCCWVIPSAE